MSDPETLKVYAEKAGDYADCFASEKPDQDLRAFMAALPAGAAVLDLGCGPGNAAAMMAAEGFTAEAWDASPEMVETARTRYGVEARVAAFQDLEAEAAYDGIWANFSLLHAPKDQFPSHLARIHRALKPGGVLHLGMKTGTGEARDRFGRFYAYYTNDELATHLADAGFSGMETRTGTSEGLAGSVDPYIILRTHA